MKRLYRLLRANELFLQAWALGTTMVTLVVYRDLVQRLPEWEACLRAIFIGCLSVGVCLLGFSALVRRLRQLWTLWHPPAPRH